MFILPAEIDHRDRFARRDSLAVPARRAFENSGNIVSQAMCSASASTLDNVLEAHSPRLLLPRSDQTSH
jgi:hypothetical protein